MNGSKRNSLLRTNLKDACPNAMNDLLNLKDHFCHSFDRQHYETRMERVDVDHPVNSNVRAYKND